MRKISLVFLGSILSAGLIACGGGSSQKEVVHKSGRLISTEHIANYSDKDIQIQGVDNTYPVKVYRLVYETKDVDGKYIDVSGLLSIPQKASTAKSPTLLYHHGTIYNNKFAPTENVNISSSKILPAFIGFVVAAPDYIGYGESLGVMHPYLNAKVTASTSIDLLRASREFLKDKNILINDQLFLGGYSQGGSATLSTQKMIEADLADEFTVTASSAGAGGYALSKDLLETSREILENFESYTVVRPSNFGLIFKAMDDGYDLNMLNEIFQPKYATIIDSIYDGKHGSDYIDAKLSKQANKLFNKDFLLRLLNGEEDDLLNAFKVNDLFDWSPKAPTRLYHGKDDAWVKFSHAQTTYDTMLSRGVINLELVECVTENNQPSNHANCFTPYLFSSYDFFLQYANDL